MSEKPTEDERMIEQFVHDLQQAHNELVKAQGCKTPEDTTWPSWTPQANSIRWAEKRLGKNFGKKGGPHP